MLFLSRHSFLSAALVAILSLMMLAEAGASPWQDSFEVGDVVEFKFLGDVVQGEVIGFTGTGWPTLQFEHNGRTHERFYPPSRLTLVESGDDDGEMIQTSELRTWTDATGSFTVEAKLVSNKDGLVELEKKDGRVVSLPLEKLGESDQAYLKELEDQANEENPFAGGKKRSPPDSENDSQSDRRRANRSKRSSSSTRRVFSGINPKFYTNEIVLTDRGWNVSPDAAKPQTPSDRVINVRSGFTKHAFHNRLGGVALDPGQRWAAVVFTNPFEEDSEVIVADTQTGETQPTLRTGYRDAELLAISPEAANVVTVVKGKGREPGRLDFWSRKNSDGPDASWNTSSFFERDGFAPTAGRYLSESRLLTFGRRVILWDCDSAAAVYSFAVADSCRPATSANGNQIAVVSGDSVFVVDSSNGKSLGRFTPPVTVNAMAFSNDGQLLAGINGQSGSIWVWDLSANELARQLSAPPQTIKSLDFIDDNYLLVNNANLMDIELRTTVWRYRSSGGTILGSYDGRHWFVGKTKLTPISIPHIDLSSQTANYDPDDLLVVEPGSEIALDIQLPFPPAERKRIQEQVSKMFQANEVAIGRDTDLELSLSIVKGKQETAEMSSIMDPFGRRGTESIKYTPQVGKIRLMRDGVTLWSRVRRFGPAGIIHMKNDESAQAAANRLCKPDPSFFKSVNMPKYISQFPSGKPLGESTISELGIQ